MRQAVGTRKMVAIVVLSANRAVVCLAIHIVVSALHIRYTTV